MARTINEIIEQADEAQARVGELYTVVENEVAADADLSDLNSVSKTAEFRIWKYVWAALAFIQETLWDEKAAEIQGVVDQQIPGTDRWFQKELMKFQFGDSLSFNTTTAKYFYATIDAAKQIIKRCAVISTGGVTLVKVAKEDGSGNPIALSAGELSAFTSYVRQIQWAGANISNPTTAASDKLNAPMTVYYNGTIALEDIKTAVEAAFNSYLQALPFNGEFSISALKDKILHLANINDVVMGTVQAKADEGSYANVDRVYTPVAGYMEKDPTINFDTMITYVAQ